MLQDLRRDNRVSKSNIVLSFCLFFIGGIFLASFQGKITQFDFKLLIYLIVFFIFISVLIRKPEYILILGGCLLFILGVIRYNNVYLNIYKNSLTPLVGEKIDLVGQIVAKPIIKNNKINFVVHPQSIRLLDSNFRLKKDYKILVISHYVSYYKHGTIVELKGKLSIPSVFNDFNYRMFLAKDGIDFIMYSPQVNHVLGNESHNLYDFLLAAKNKMRISISRLLPLNQSLILRSIILGDKNYLTPELKDKLNKVGIRHIVAISGMHIVIIESILMALLLGIGLWRSQALYFTLIFSLIFIVFTGFQTSAIRAWIMGSFYIFSSLIGGKSSSYRVLIFTACLMLIFNPLILRYDISFQLSFLAVIGIIYLSPFFNQWLKFIPNKKFMNLRSILSMTLSAQIATLPLLVYYFGHISLIAPLTNILIIPVLPLLIFFGLLFSVVSLLWPLLGFIFVFPCYFFLTYIEGTINFLSKFPFYVQIHISLIYVLFLYFILIFFAWWKYKKRRMSFLNY